METAEEPVKKQSHRIVRGMALAICIALTIAVSANPQASAQREPMALEEPVTVPDANPLSTVPEPSTLVLIAIGAAGVIAYRYRRRH